MYYVRRGSPDLYSRYNDICFGSYYYCPWGGDQVDPWLLFFCPDNYWITWLTDYLWLGWVIIMSWHIWWVKEQNRYSVYTYVYE